MWNANANAERTIAPERRPIGSGSSFSGAAHPDDAEASTASVLGKTLLFRGELTAEEDLILQGRVEGSVRHARNLTIGSEGSVLGDIYANHLTIEGLVEGDLHANEAVIVRASAQVRGNIFAPRVGIMEGASFNGRIEMSTGPLEGRAASPAAPSARPAAGPAPGASARSPAVSPSGAPMRPPAGPPPGTAARPAAPPAGPAATPPFQPAAAQKSAAALGETAVDQMLSSK